MFVPPQGEKPVLMPSLMNSPTKELAMKPMDPVMKFEAV
jgi:hypothetical protein